MRDEFPRKVKRQAFERAKGHCEMCTAKLYPGKFEYDHRTPCDLRGLASLENCVVACTSCHKEKTRKDDVPRIAKGRRIRVRVGPFDTKAAADAAAQTIQGMGLDAVIFKK